jgi:hypothetical protein
MTATDKRCPIVFFRQYVETLLWCGVLTYGPDGLTPDHDLDLDVDDVPPSILAQLREDCDAFWSEFGERIEAIATEHDRNFPDWLASQAGHDFYLTRNRHGAGFWDGDWPAPLSHHLTVGSHAYGPESLHTWEDGTGERHWEVVAS